MLIFSYNFVEIFIVDELLLKTSIGFKQSSVANETEKGVRNTIYCELSDTIERQAHAKKGNQI